MLPYIFAMEKCYKSIGLCRMCKSRFVIKNTPERPFASKNYCSACAKKYFKN
jgi:hypothetical protein